MANAKKCDRCGKYYEEREMNAFEAVAKSIEKAFTPQTEIKCIMAIEGLLDLCPACSKSLKEWVKGAKKEDGK